MGRKNKKYYKDLHQQAYDKLTGMQAFGESKREAVANGTDRDKIFSFNTYQTYWKHTKYFIKWIQEKHPECTTLKSAKKHVNEWLQTRVDQGLSAYTVQTEAKAIGKLYGIQPDDPEYFNPPKRERANITRSRGDRVRDQHFSVANNDELIKFCQGTGLRRSDYQISLNQNLLRINKEKSNAERKLRPKKEHTGYVVISSQEKEVRYKAGKRMQSLVVWETILQSPYSIDFPEEQARTQIYNELLTNEGGWKLGDIGITSRYMASLEEMVENLGQKIFEQNRAYSQRLRANYKAGYWEYIVLHTLPLERVPKNMLP